MAELESFHYILKIIALGDASVGKTSLTYRYASNRFDEDYRMTLGMNLVTKNITLTYEGKETSIQLSIWDTGGQSSFASLLPMYYRGALGALMVYDLTKRKTFESLDKWINDVKEHCNEIPIVIIGNKKDLDEKIVVSTEEGEAKAAEVRKNWKSPVFFYETSAKEDLRVDESFTTLAQSILELVEQEDDVEEPEFRALQ